MDTAGNTNTVNLLLLISTKMDNLLNDYHLMSPTLNCLIVQMEMVILEAKYSLQGTW